MHYQTTRKLARSAHFIIAAFQMVYIYSPLHNWPQALAVVQWVTFPLLFISGLWLARGHSLWNLCSKYRAQKVLPAQKFPKNTLDVAT